MERKPLMDDSAGRWPRLMAGFASPGWIVIVSDGVSKQAPPAARGRLHAYFCSFYFWQPVTFFEGESEWHITLTHDPSFKACTLQ